MIHYEKSGRSNTLQRCNEPSHVHITRSSTGTLFEFYTCLHNSFCPHHQPTLFCVFLSSLSLFFTSTQPKCYTSFYRSEEHSDLLMRLVHRSLQHAGFILWLFSLLFATLLRFDGGLWWHLRHMDTQISSLAFFFLFFDLFRFFYSPAISQIYSLRVLKLLRIEFRGQ